jgi:TonB family protein
MRVLVVDQDSALLTAITRLLGEYFSIDAVTTKADCLDLVRTNEFDVIVAGERLEDGSGLELLGQMGRDRPDMLRIFAVDRERLKLLKGRLGPFRLFRTLSYPIAPRQLLAALSAAAGIEEDLDGIEDAVAPEVAPAPMPAPAPPPPSYPEPVEVTVRSVRQHAPEPQVRREVHDFTLVDEEEEPAPAPKPKPPRKSGKSRTAPRPGRQPTPEALALGSRLAAASQVRDFPPPLLEPSAKRSAFMVGAGVVVAIGVMAVALHVFNTPDRPPFSTASLSARSTHDPPEVVKLLADTEAAFQQDDYKAARTDIAALQQIAPTHPRLPFFESLLAKGKSGAAPEPPSSGPARWFARHFSTSKVSHAPARTSQRLVSNSARSRPGSTAPAAPATFSGKTLEDSSASANTHEPEIIKRVPADYPDAAARKGIEGAVDLSFVVSPSGEVEDVTVVHAEPSAVCNHAAVSAVRRWKYQPRMVNGVAVEGRVQLRMTFKLDGQS